MNAMNVIMAAIHPAEGGRYSFPQHKLVGCPIFMWISGVCMVCREGGRFIAASCVKIFITVYDCIRPCRDQLVKVVPLGSPPYTGFRLGEYVYAVGIHQRQAYP